MSEKITPQSVSSWKIENDLVLVVDLDGNRSVNNDAEAAVAYLIG